ncbi:MAG: AAA family ATPase, partial [Clostridia bacterium]|nr:AAA family ATPase [Clostridia bacterium]
MTTIDRIMIERIDISAFGGVKNLTLIPSGGINIITAPNESGKSTVAAFIKFIFYGFGGQRRQALAENERSLYMPWDGSRAGGGITLSTPEGKFRIERYQSAAKETLDIYDAYTRKSVFTGLVPGEVFFGVGEETFSKVLFFRQLYQSKNGDDALAEQVQNIIFSADEKTNTERAVKRLKELRASLKNNQKRGMIPTLENELASYDEKLASSVSIKNELDTVLVSLGEKKQKIAFNRTKLDALEKEKENLRKYEAKQKLASLLSLARADKDAQARYEECVKQFSGENIPDTELVRSLINDNSELALAEKRVLELTDASSAEKSRLASIEGSDPFGGADTAKIKSSLKRRTALGYLFLALCVACIGGAAALYFTSGAGIPVFACAGGAALFAALFAIFVLGKPRDVKKYGFTAKAGLVKALDEQPL